jgi:hypothetical protein
MKFSFRGETAPAEGKGAASALDPIAELSRERGCKPTAALWRMAGARPNPDFGSAGTCPENKIVP